MGLIFLIALFSIILSISALVRTSTLNRELELLRAELRGALRKTPAATPEKTIPAQKTE